jgi:hypothetical protein
MEQSRITFVINGNTYSLDAGDSAAIRKMSAQDRRELIKLLEAIKQQEGLPPVALPGAQDRAQISPMSSPASRTYTTPITAADRSSSRMGSGDIDAMMARLIAEEKRGRKQGLTKAGIYKLMAGLLLVVFLLVIIL